MWILHYGNDPYWMRQSTADRACSDEIIKMAANQHFVTADVTLREDNVTTLAGMVSNKKFKDSIMAK